MTNEDIALSIGLKIGSLNYKNFMDIMDNISILNRVEQTSKTLKFSDIKVLSISLDGFSNEHIMLDIGFPLTITVQENILLSASAEIDGRAVKVSKSLNSLMTVIQDEDDWDSIDIAEFKRFAREAHHYRELTLSKLANLALAIKNKYKKIVPAPSIETNLTIEDKIPFFGYAEPMFFYFDSIHPYSFIKIGEYVGYFNEDYELTHIGLVVKNNHDMINISTDLELLGELQEASHESEKATGYDLYEKFSDAVEKFATIT